MLTFLVSTEFGKSSRHNIERNMASGIESGMSSDFKQGRTLSLQLTVQVPMDPLAHSL